MDLRHLESLYWVALLRSFRDAANKLNTTQPNISGRIRALEEELGIELFSRSGRHVRLLPKGREIFGHAERVLESIAAIRGVAGETEHRGTVRLGCTNTVAHTWLPQLIGEIHQSHPALDIDFHVDTSSVLLERHRSRELDIVICVQRPSSPDVVTHSLYRSGFCWLASRHLDFATNPVTVEELGKNRIITYQKDTQFYEAICAYFRESGVWPIRISGSNSVAAIARLTLSGVGICAIPGAAAEGYLSPDMRVLVAEKPLPAVEFFVSYHKDPYSRAAAVIAEISRKICEGLSDVP